MTSKRAWNIPLFVLLSLFFLFCVLICLSASRIGIMPLKLKKDYPIDEYTLSSSFPDKETGAKWLNYHFEHFLKREDLVAIKEAGATHVRVPIPHWILEEPRDDEPWIAGDRWKYFVRAARWCREIGLEVWPDLHTAPVSQAKGPIPLFITAYLLDVT